jgi:uncharacterized repeat protein (TIGR03803 family)
MKKSNLLIIALFCFGMGTGNAQYADLLDFNGTDGNFPLGSLTMSLSGNILYGMTNQGGTGNGNVFSIYTNGTGYKDLLAFNVTNGGSPDGSLALCGSKLFGMTEFGGANSKGVIFSIDTNGTGYKDLHDFNITNGANPLGSLILSQNGRIMYGMTEGGGANGDGLIFSIDTDGNNYKDLLNFNNTDGLQPYGTLTLSTSGSVLYGMAYGGGANHYGLVFSMDTNGTGFKDLLDFDYTNGQNPSWTSLTLSGKVLYGMAHLGGANGYGTLFAIDTDGTRYKDLVDFGNGKGQYPQGSLILSGSTLYGMTSQGGTHQYGRVFSVDTSGSGYADLYDFNDTVGATPWGSLTFSTSKDTVYGMTRAAGTFGDGVIFSLIVSNITGLPPISNSSLIKIYPEPNTGYFYISGIKPGQVIELYNYLGQMLMSKVAEEVAMYFNIGASANGLYFVRILNKDGSLATEKKMEKTR